MKKIKVWVNTWWFKKIIVPYMLRHKPICTVALKDAIVYQMWHGGIGFVHINKWLITMKLDPIRGYMMMPHDKLKMFYEVPDLERRKKLGGKYVPVII